jgi:hypothetical protein
MAIRRNMKGASLALGAIGLGLWLGWATESDGRPPPPADRLVEVRAAKPVQASPPIPAPPVAAASLTPASPPVRGRPASEWQGMQVDASMQATCGTADGCGLAMACHGERCGPCAADSECASGEICVLEHCLRRELANCRSSGDCGGEERCLLSGYSSDPRGNADLRAICLEDRGGRIEVPEERRWSPVPGGKVPISPSDLLQSLEERR